VFSPANALPLKSRLSDARTFIFNLVVLPISKPLGTCFAQITSSGGEEVVKVLLQNRLTLVRPQ